MPIVVPIVVLAGLAAWLAVPPARLPRPAGRLEPAAQPREAPRRRRSAAALALLAGAAGPTMVGGPTGWVLGPVVAGVAWRVLVSAEPRDVRRSRERAARELPHLVGLLADALASGQPPAAALRLVAVALPGPAADRLAVATSALDLGEDPATAWRRLADDPVLARLGRALERAHRTGAPIAATMHTLALDLAGDRRADAEEQARRVGVRAAVPLGVCLLPAFVLVGIVPLAASLLAQVLGE